uniref:Uncharacterized protein n=1 Tax=Salix viminalis TaxID=40686 RepID=A0A6N2KSU1_SALVM
MIGLSGVMNWAGKAKHYGAFIVIISPAFGYQPSLIPHTRTLMLQSASKSREGEARFYCIIYTNSECPAHVLILFLMEPIPSAMKSYGFEGIEMFQIFRIFLLSCWFDNLIFGVLKLCFRSKHTSKERLFEEESAFMGSDVELHDEPDRYGLLAATSLEGCLPNAMGVNCVDPDNKQWASPHALSNESAKHRNLLPKWSLNCKKIILSVAYLRNCVRASYLSAFTEVILGCEIMNNEFKHAIDDISAGGKITIYLHLKKYFCGTLFTRLCFLERPKENHKLGDVCVHGKEGVSFRFAGNSFGSFPQRCYGLLGCTPWLQQAFKMQQAQVGTLIYSLLCES